MLAKPSLTLERRLKASPAQVFSAWADPEKIVRWFGPKETTDCSVKAEMDVRPGGRYRISFKTGDGEYHEVGGVSMYLSDPDGSRIELLSEPLGEMYGHAVV